MQEVITLGGNCLREIVRGAIVLEGNCPGGSCLGVTRHGEIVQGAVVRGAVVQGVGGLSCSSYFLLLFPSFHFQHFFYSHSHHTTSNQ